MKHGCQNAFAGVQSQHLQLLCHGFLGVEEAYTDKCADGAFDNEEQYAMAAMRHLEDEMTMLEVLIALRKRRSDAAAGKIDVAGLRDLWDSGICHDLLVREDWHKVEELLKEAERLNEEAKAANAVSREHVKRAFQATMSKSRYDAAATEFEAKTRPPYIAPIRPNDTDIQLFKKLMPIGGEARPNRDAGCYVVW